MTVRFPSGSVRPGGITGRALTRADSRTVTSGRTVPNVHRDESGRTLRPDSQQRKSTLLYQLSEMTQAWRAGRTASGQVAAAMVRARGAGATPAEVQRVTKLTTAEILSLMEQQR